MPELSFGVEFAAEETLFSPPHRAPSVDSSPTTSLCPGVVPLAVCAQLVCIHAAIQPTDGPCVRVCTWAGGLTRGLGLEGLPPVLSLPSGSFGSVAGGAVSEARTADVWSLGVVPWPVITGTAWTQ